VPRQFLHVSRSVNMCVTVIALNKCGKSDSQIFKLLKPLKFLRNFIYWAVNRHKELRSVEDSAWSGHPRCVRTKAAIKTVQERIHQNLLRKQKSLSQELNMSPQLPHQGRATRKSLPAVEGTPPYFRREGGPTDKNRTSPPMARQEWTLKRPFHGQENLHCRGAVQTPE
jgi:hypothetical protein